MPSSSVLLPRGEGGAFSQKSTSEEKQRSPSPSQRRGARGEVKIYKLRKNYQCFRFGSVSTYEGNPCKKLAFNSLDV